MTTSVRAPDPPDERGRLAALRAYAILDTPSDAAFDELTELAATICGMPISLVTLVDEERQWFKSHHGLEVGETDRDSSFCAWAVANDEMFVVPDALEDDRFRHNPLVQGDPNIRFYAGAPLRTPEGHVLGTLCLIDRVPRHLTAEQRTALRTLARAAMAQLDLHKQNRELRELDRLKDEFVAGVSHELRTPLTSIRGYVETLLEEEAGPLTADQQRFLRIADRNVARLLKLVGDLLFIAQVSAGRLELEPAAADLGELLRETADHVRPTASANDIELVVDAPSIEARVDPSRIAQLFDNLASNAVKFTPAGGRVELTLVHTGDGALLTVSDSGIGVPADEVPALFDRFMRASNASGIPGTGLGLAISKTIAEAHGGSIAVRSEEGKGTTFEVRIPV